MSRPLSEIAREVRNDPSYKPQKGQYAAEPYRQAMAEMDSISEPYYQDSGVSVVLYFLSNANTWRGETARRIKTELKQMAKVQ